MVPNAIELKVEQQRCQQLARIFTAQGNFSFQTDNGCDG